MLHHLPGEARRAFLREARRVLKPGGRMLAVDFAAPQRKHGSFLAHFHRHGYVNFGDVVATMSAADLRAVESGLVGFRDLQFVLAAPAGSTLAGSGSTGSDGLTEAANDVGNGERAGPRAHVWMLALLAVILVAGHGTVLYYVSSHVAVSGAVALGVTVLLVLKHLGLLAGLLGPVYALIRRRSASRGGGGS